MTVQLKTPFKLNKGARGIEKTGNSNSACERTAPLIVKDVEVFRPPKTSIAILETITADTDHHAETKLLMIYEIGENTTIVTQNTSIIAMWTTHLSSLGDDTRYAEPIAVSIKSLMIHMQ